MRRHVTADCPTSVQIIQSICRLLHIYSLATRRPVYLSGNSLQIQHSDTDGPNILCTAFTEACRHNLTPCTAMFRQNILPPSSGYHSPKKHQFDSIRLQGVIFLNASNFSNLDFLDASWQCVPVTLQRLYAKRQISALQSTTLYIHTYIFLPLPLTSHPPSAPNQKYWSSKLTAFFMTCQHDKFAD
jgi:hypothetical protein